jgi:hypothetical protein
MVSKLIHNGGRMVVECWYNGVRMVSEWFYKNVRMVVEWCYLCYKWSPARTPRSMAIQQTKRVYVVVIILLDGW